MLTTHSSIRENNTHLVLKQIINHPNISRAEVAKQTKLNKATISAIVKNLIDQSYVIETGIGQSSSSGGRKPVLLRINKHAGMSVSFDIRYDKISYMAAFLNGEVNLKKEIEMKIDKDNIVSVIENIVDHFQKTMTETPFGIIGITIAIHGTVSNNKIHFTPYYNINKISLAQLLEERLQLPIFIENEANLAALAESTYDTEHNNLISCSIHTGIGAGIIIDQKLYRGFKGKSGEIGHTTLYPGGVQCPCGNKGCFEQYCSEQALLHNYQEAQQNPSLTIEDLITNYKKNDPTTTEIVDTFAKNLSIGLYNLIGTFSPEVIYINSKIVYEIPDIIDNINHQLSYTIHKDFPILISSINGEASLMGATILNIQNFLEIQALKF